MNFSLKPHQLVAHFIPGFLLVGFLVLGAWHNYRVPMEDGLNRLGPAMGVLAIGVLSFALGGLLDAVRDLGENVIDRCTRWKVGWHFIFRFGPGALQRLEDYYFTFYVFSANIALGFPIGLLVSYDLSIFPRLSTAVWGVLITAWLVNLADAISLRGEIIKLVNSHDKDHLK